MTKKYLMTLWVVCHGQRYKFLKWFNVYEEACAELEKYEDMFYFLVTDYNWDCSEDREHCNPDEPLYWFVLDPSSMPREDFNVEGQVIDITEDDDCCEWVINYLD